MEQNLQIFPSTSEESDSKSIIWAPVPRKQFYAKPEYIFEYKESDEPLLMKKYKELLNHYKFTQRCEIIVIRILKDSIIPKEYSNYPLLKLLSEISAELMFTEIELAGFCIYLNRFVWPLVTDFFPVLLYTVGLAVKHHFEDKIEPLQMHLVTKVPNFLSFFSGWMNKNDDYLHISMQELNKVYFHLTKGIFNDLHIDYNFYVDSILEIAPASIYEKPLWQEQLKIPTQIDGIPELPSLVTLDSVMAIAEMPEFPSLTKFISISSVGSFALVSEFNEI